MNKPIKNYNKAILTIISYLLYQFNFFIMIIDGLILKFSKGTLSFNKINRSFRISIIGINDLFFVLFIVYLFKDNIKKGLKDLKNNFNKRAFISIKCWLIGCLLMFISSLIISIFLKQDISKNEAGIRESIKIAPFYMLFTCSIVAPIFEEMVFRKSINIFIRNKYIFILTSGLLFGFLHVIGQPNLSLLDFLYVIPYGSMGCAFAYLLTKTENITLPIIVHMMHNTILIISQFIRG